MKRVLTIAILSCFTVYPPGDTAAQTGRRKTIKPQTAKSLPAPPAPTTGSVSIEAGLIFQSGDVKPVARTTFYLMDADLREVLKPFGGTPGSLRSQLDFLRAFSGYPKAKADYDKLKGTVEQHVVTTVTTGFDGKANFSDVRPGVWFIYGAYKVGKNEVAWHVKVEVKSGIAVTLILDNSNESP